MIAKYDLACRHIVVSLFWSVTNLYQPSSRIRTSSVTNGTFRWPGPLGIYFTNPAPQTWHRILTVFNIRFRRRLTFMLAISKDTVRLLRIPFSLFLAPVYLLALSQAAHPTPEKALYTFLIIHLLVYPASNGYNSYI